MSQDSPKIIVKVLKQVVHTGKKMNALGTKATYSEVTHACGLYEVATHQLALFAPQILKLVRKQLREAK